MTKINENAHANSAYFRGRPPEQVEQIKIHVDNLKKEKDTAGRVSFYIQLGILKGFRGWCIQKGYVDQTDPTREWLAKDFQKSPYFIGYEAGPRLCDLCDRGLAWRTGKDGRFMKFQLTEKGINFLIPSDMKLPKAPAPAEPLLAELDTGTILWQGDPTDILIMALCRKFDIMPSYKIFGGSYSVFPIKYHHAK